MLEVGRGPGRMTASCAPPFRFGLRSGHLRTDAESGKAASGGLPAYSYVLGDGHESVSHPERICDFVFCYLVLQYLPAEDLDMAYVGEMLSALKQWDALVSVQWRQAPNYEPGSADWQRERWTHSGRLTLSR